MINKKMITEKFRTTEYEANKAQLMSDRYFKGNKSAWYRYAALNSPIPKDYTKKKTEK